MAKFESLDVKSFLAKYKKDMSQEDVIFFKQFDKFQADFENTIYCESRYGTHWSNCVWSHEEENITGPDTCMCHYLSCKREKALFLIRLYSDAAKGRDNPTCSICWIKHNMKIFYAGLLT